MVSFGYALEEELPQIVALLRDDQLGADRESDDMTAYRQAFDEISVDPNHSVLVARDGSQVVAVLQLTMLPNLSRGGMKRALIEGVRVHSSRRGEGIGKALVEEAIGEARAAGCGIVQLTTDRTRPESVRFYEGLGFEDSHHGMKLHL